MLPLGPSVSPLEPDALARQSWVTSLPRERFFDTSVVRATATLSRGRSASSSDVIGPRKKAARRSWSREELHRLEDLGGEAQAGEDAVFQRLHAVLQAGAVMLD